MAALGDRIPPMTPPRVAAGQATHGEPGAPGRAVHLQRLDGVARAAGHVPAGRDPPGERVLVQADRGAQGSSDQVRSGRPQKGGVSRQDVPRTGPLGPDLMQQSCSMTSGDRVGDPRTCWSPPWAARRRGRPPPEVDPARPPTRETWLAGDDAGGCAPPRSPPAGRWRRRPAGPRRRTTRTRGGSRSRPRPAHGCPTGGVRSWCGDHAPARSGRQAMAALEPAASQHRPAGAIRHPVPEPVALGAPTDVGLIGALHDLPPEPRSLPGPRRVPTPWGVWELAASRPDERGAAVVSLHAPKGRRVA